MLTDLFFLRKAANLTQRQLAERSGVSKSTINVIEQGEKIPRIDTVCRIAAALDMQPEGLFIILTSGENYRQKR